MSLSHCLEFSCNPERTEGGCVIKLRAAETGSSTINLLFLPLAVDCAQRHAPQLRIKFGQLGNVVCNLWPEYVRKHHFNIKG